MVGVACLLAGEVGDVVLPDERLPVDGDKRLDGEAAEVSAVIELAVLPRCLVTLVARVVAIIIDVHGFLILMCFTCLLRCKGTAFGGACQEVRAIFCGC